MIYVRVCGRPPLIYSFQCRERHEVNGVVAVYVGPIREVFQVRVRQGEAAVSYGPSYQLGSILVFRGGVFIVGDPSFVISRDEAYVSTLYTIGVNRRVSLGLRVYQDARRFSLTILGRNGDPLSCYGAVFGALVQPRLRHVVGRLHGLPTVRVGNGPPRAVTFEDEYDRLPRPYI